MALSGLSAFSSGAPVDFVVLFDVLLADPLPFFDLVNLISLVELVELVEFFWVLYSLHLIGSLHLVSGAGGGSWWQPQLSLGGGLRSKEGVGAGFGGL